MKSQVITKEMMSGLLALSKKPKHPYFYKFQYSTELKSYIAQRIRKNENLGSLNRREYLSTPLNPNGAMNKALNRIKKNQEKITQSEFTRELYA